MSKRKIAIVSACMNANGTPAFALGHVEATHEEIENGIHYYLAEAELFERGYEEPFVHFDEDEAPAFLHPWERQALSQADTVRGQNQKRPLEVSGCPASSK